MKYVDSEILFLDEIVLQQCRKSPKKTAIEFESTQLSYQQLALKINTLAGQLSAAGVHSGDFVAVLLPPCAEISIALLAITRMGGIYAPLDPEQEDATLKPYFQATPMRCIVTTESLAERFKGWADTIIAVDTLNAEPTAELIDAPPRDLSQPACIFFTSGTTGTAKGVLGSALALRNSIIDPAKALNFSQQDVLNSIARYAWSISMLEILVPLVVGGTSLVLDRKKALNLAWLQQQAQKCTAFHCPPALLRSFAYFLDSSEKDPQLSEAHLRLVWYGGDVFSSDNISLLQKVFANADIGTAYGCTEIFGLSHIHIYPRTSQTPNVLIGKPIKGMGQKIVDEQGQVCSAGNVGEIWLSGPRIAMEYRNNTQLTQQKFFENEQSRYFKTGDFAHLHQDGSLEFLTRKDSQVKIRGIRIELAEIEHAINQIDGVRESVVLAVEGVDNDKQLRAFVVASQNQSLNEQRLVTDLQGKLADYKMPSEWFFLDKWPVTENFKIDRKALLAMRPATQSNKLPAFVAPLAAIWQEVNGKAPSSLEDHYFNNGGNSILAMQLAVKISRTFNTKFDVVDVYKNPTLAGQADFLNLSDADHTEGKSSNSDPLGSDLPVIATRSQIGLFFRELLYSKGESITCTRYIRYHLAFDPEKVRWALKQLLDHHKTLRTNLVVSKPNTLLETRQYSQDEITVSYAEGAWSLNSGERTLKKQALKFNIKQEPLIAAIISRLTEGGEVLQLTTHHIAADDNSMNRLAAEFLALYDAYPNRQNVSLLEPALDFTNYAQQQARDIQAGVHAAAAAALAGQLATHLPAIVEQPLLELANSKHERSLATELPSTTQGLDTTQLLAALSWVFSQRTTRRTFVFCAHSATKQDLPESSVVGMFVNLVPIVITVAPSTSFTSHLAYCKAEFQKAMARSDLPYELLFDENEDLKKVRKYPFDAYVNELIFTERYIGDYENLYVPRNFATDKSTLCVSYLQVNGTHQLQLDTPWSEELQQPLSTLFDEICTQIEVQTA